MFQYNYHVVSVTYYFEPKFFKKNLILAKCMSANTFHESLKLLNNFFLLYSYYVDDCD